MEAVDCDLWPVVPALDHGSLQGLGQRQHRQLRLQHLPDPVGRQQLLAVAAAGSSWRRAGVGALRSACQLSALWGRLELRAHILYCESTSLYKHDHEQNFNQKITQRKE